MASSGAGFRHFPIQMRPSDLLLYLVGHRGAIERIAASRQALWAGALRVVSAGIARNYDHLSLLAQPEWILGPFGMSLFSAGLIWLMLMAGISVYSQNGKDPAFRTFLTFFWLTAPCAWLYGFPVERFTDLLRATQWNFAFLIVVSVWRVALIVRVVNVLTGAAAGRVLAWVMLPACIEMGLGSLIKGLSLVSIMGGVRLPPHHAFIKQASGVVMTGSFWLGLASLLGELGHAAARERAQRRLEAFVAGEAARRLAPLRKLEAAVADGRIKGLARGLAYRLIEAGGVLDRALVRTEAKALSPVERRALRALGVRLGAFSLYMPGLLNPDARALAQAFAARQTDWRPAPEGLTVLPQPVPEARVLAAYGLRAVGGRAVAVEALERLDELLRVAVRQGGGAILSDPARMGLGWSADETRDVLRGLGFAPSTRPKDGEPVAWRRRIERNAALAPASLRPASPFAALAALKDQPAPARRPRRRRKPKTARA